MLVFIECHILSFECEHIYLKYSAVKYYILIEKKIEFYKGAVERVFSENVECMNIVIESSTKIM